MTTMMESVRLRVTFKERHILSKSQKTEGLKRSWVLLKPHHRTVSDLAAHLLHAFDLNASCPDGLLISMDGFVLPPFESTSIFRDKDIISVKRKGGTLSEIALVDDGTDSLEIEEIVERRPLNTGIKLLANEEFEKETGGYESESEEDEPYQLEDPLTVEDAPETGTSRRSKKRKLSNKPQSSKRKRIKSAKTEECSSFPEDLQNDVHAEKHQSRLLPRKRRSKKDKSFAGEDELDNLSTPQTDKRTNKTSKFTSNGKRSCQLQEKEVKGVVSSDTPGGSKKFPSRSARRKKAKRQWLREKLKSEKEELNKRQLLKPDNQQSSGKSNQRCPEEHQQPNTDNEEDEQSNTDNDEGDEQPKTDNNEVHVQPSTDNDKEDDVVPVVIRPGYIRFENLGKVDADHPIQQNRTPVETFQWNGITSKKRGQKWGMEKTPHSRKSDYEDLNPESPEALDSEKEIPVDDPIDFNKLELCTTLPEEGDQIAYRLIELSACWTPEVSSYRVGKVSWYDPQSNKMMLVQVPGYPIVFEETDDEASDVLPDASLYGEDGSLEVDYSSLIDVRIVKHGNPNTAKAVTGDQNAASGPRLNNNKEIHAAPQENGKVSAWDEISQALNAKKAELSQSDGWSRNEGSVRNSWSYRGLRGSALGPIVARLRTQSGL
ncbi:PREDICTED: coilin [Prunus dulcis]|uniref:PREDICTED: coilin n=1 Tax=Prunus dulcis TaxID=3755 RepID=A0A5E4EBW0_PRUDU|nr:coilin [Prunus dulcis]VVA13303.1 PREDICTED: coilin [Prunus dulcis]